MSEAFLYDLRVLPRLEQDGRMGVAQPVQG